jgi:PTH1 family peptidyl-tRNA hydrolase
LGHIQQLIGQQYARLRMGIGNDYPQGMQIDYVLGRFTSEELQLLQPTLDLSVDIIKSFVLAGIDVTMNQYNKLGKKSPISPKDNEQ